MISFGTGKIGALRVSLLLGMAVTGFGMPGIAQAQEEAQPAAPAEQAEADSGNEIVITATKREQTLQDVPVAVSVTTAETIERAQIRDIRDLSSVVPSLRVNQLQSSANTNFYIRGFGNGANNAGIEPSVGLFVDGVYRSRSASMISDLPDVQRVEVLRGPQSTLFGKNASAGVISLVTREPKFTLGGNVEASYGNFNALVLKGVVTGPISETVAASLAAGYNRRDGYVDDLGSGAKENERNRWFVRGQVLFEPSNDFKIRLIGDYGKIDENCCAVVNLRASSATQAIQALGGQVNNAATPFADVVYNNFPSTNKIENWGLSGQVDYGVGPLKLTSITAFRHTKALTNQDSDFTSADLLGRNSQDLRIDTFTQEFRAATDWDGPINAVLGAFYFHEKINQSNSLLLGTQFRPYADLLIRGQSNNAFNLAAVETLLGSLSGDPTLYAGKSFAAGTGFAEAYKLKDDSLSFFGQVDYEVTDRLTLTGGVSYTHDSKTYSTNSMSNEVFSAIPLASFVPSATNLFIAQGVATALGNPGGLTIATPTMIQTMATGGYGAAAQTAYNTIIVPTATTTAQGLLGLQALQFLPPFLNVPNAVEGNKISGGNWSFTARAAYDVTDSVNAYISFATGYKAASINLSRDSRPTPEDLVKINTAGIGLPNLTAGSRYAGPEKSTVYEFGVKGNWGVVSANMAVFKQIIRGFQSNIFTGTGFFLANAGKQSSFGIEFEGQAKPTKELTLNASVTYLDPKYDQFLLSAFGDLSGTRPGGVTQLSTTLGAQYDRELGNGDHVILRGDWHYEAPFKLIEGLPGFVNLIGAAGAVDLARQFKQEINQVNASFTYAMANGLELSVWGRNLTDTRTILQIFDSPAQLGSISGYPSEPRTYGVSARFKW